MPDKLITKYGIFYPGEDKPRGELFDFMSTATMHLVCGPAKDFNAAEIRPVSVPEGEEAKQPCE